MDTLYRMMYKEARGGLMANNTMTIRFYEYGDMVFDPDFGGFVGADVYEVLSCELEPTLATLTYHSLAARPTLALGQEPETTARQVQTGSTIDHIELRELERRGANITYA